MKLLSFVIPCYHSEKTIQSVVEEIENTMLEHSITNYEIILVSDGSPDNVYQMICKMNQNDHRVKGCEFAKNYGQHAALLAGLRMTKGDIVVCLDDDGQTPPREAFKLISALEKGADVAYAKYAEKKHSRFRNLGSFINGKMAEVMLEKPHDLYLSSYFAARRFVVNEVIRYENPYPYLMGLVLRATRNIVNVEIIHHDREKGKSGYTLRKLLMLWLNGFTAFSVKPLRVATLMGVFLALVGFMYSIWTIINRFINPNAPMGWTSTIIIMLILGGMILFVLGLIGEYIGRIYISINNAPQYVIREETMMSMENKKEKEQDDSMIGIEEGEGRRS